ncbi:ATP-binding protein [Sporomusa sp.]|uniref:ATP-binding protein n=1 Tax=Sporomusa sp. TaxID=2078658 RepID=UPI002B83D8E3|nr:ATP-binding protein [Sporomusa sp.]MDF2876312.1 Histidine kinaselike ATPase domain protein [Sporomusa sp.]HWR08005.1 ATP-binding protein [Sporomusa sp.]
MNIEVMTHEVNGADALIELRPRMRQIFTGLAGADTGKVEIIFNEAVNNAFRQGSKVRVKIRKIGEKLILRVKDSGHGFAGNLLLHSLCSQDMDQLFDEKLIDESGRGLLIMKAMADEVCFNHQGNEIMLVIKLGYNN